MTHFIAGFDGFESARGRGKSGSSRITEDVRKETSSDFSFLLYFVFLPETFKQYIFLIVPLYISQTA